MPKPKYDTSYADCKYCGKRGLFWGCISLPGAERKAWRLLELTGKPHQCKQARDNAAMRHRFKAAARTRRGPDRT